MAPKWLTLAIVIIITLACIGMVRILAPGLPAELSLDARLAYIAANKSAWQLAWLLWMASAFGLLLFCFFLLAYIPDSVAKYFGITVLAIGIVPDISAEVLYSFVLPWLASSDLVNRRELFGLVEVIAMQLTGAFGNGAYNIGGLILNSLLFANGKLPRWLIWVGLPSWLLGLALSVAVALYDTAAAQFFMATAIVWNVLWMFAVALIVYTAPKRYKVG